MSHSVYILLNVLDGCLERDELDWPALRDIPMIAEKNNIWFKSGEVCTWDVGCHYYYTPQVCRILAGEEGFDHFSSKNSVSITDAINLQELSWVFLKIIDATLRVFQWVLLTPPGLYNVSKYPNPTIGRIRTWHGPAHEDRNYLPGGINDPLEPVEVFTPQIPQRTYVQTIETHSFCLGHGSNEVDWKFTTTIFSRGNKQIFHSPSQTRAFSGKTYWTQQCLPALALSKLTLFELPIESESFDGADAMLESRWGSIDWALGVFQIGYSFFLFNSGSTVVQHRVGFEESSSGRYKNNVMASEDLIPYTSCLDIFMAAHVGGVPMLSLRRTYFMPMVFDNFNLQMFPYLRAYEQMWVIPYCFHHSKGSSDIYVDRP
ncbi:hypothetical protein JB92DRAFT_2833836 [Gautieria morchelliformis]|nr:hypothetical protein JB92DRAFT_2833836 [Gautieria morchelliformis]